MTKDTQTENKRELAKTQAGIPSAKKNDANDNIVDESSEESFPASDSPASFAGKDIAPQDRKPG